MVYYGVTMNSGNLGGSFYVNFLLMGAAELPGYFVGIALLNRIGRRYALAGSLLVSGLACLCTMPTVLLARDGSYFLFFLYYVTSDFFHVTLLIKLFKICIRTDM